MNVVETYNTSKYRYPGAQPFAKEQKGIFYGREKDVKKILDTISIEDLFVLYSKSGVGKSSILNAAIIPALEDNLNTLVLPIRFGAFNSDLGSSPLGICHNHLVSSTDNVDLIRQISPTEDSLWYHIKQLHDQNPTHQFVLIFDQFEELFTYPESEVKAFKKELAELINTQIPERIRLNLEKVYNQREDWINNEAFDALHAFPEVKIIMAIRSDRLALLNQLSDELPTVLKVCYELQHLSAEDAEDAILNPAFKRDEGFISIPFDYEDDAIDAILRYLSNEGKDKIESVQLQIICQAMEQKVIQNKLKRITFRETEGIDQIYTNYYTNQIAKLSSPADKALARILIEEGLIFEEEQRRLNLFEGQIYKNYNLSPEVLRNLVDIHLLRAETTMRGGYTYEITHDSMVPSILEAKRARIEVDKKQAEAQEKAAQEKELEALKAENQAERKKKMLARSIAILAILFGLLATAAAIFALQQTKIAFQAKRSAEIAEAKSHVLYQNLQDTIKKSTTLQYNLFLSEGENQFKQKNYENAFKFFNQALVFAQRFKIDNNGAQAKQKIEANQFLYSQTNEFEERILQGDLLFAKGGIFLNESIIKYRKALELGINNDLARNKIRETELKIEIDYETLMTRGRGLLELEAVEEACQQYKLALLIKPKDQLAQKLVSQICNK